MTRRFASGNSKQVLVVAGEPSGDLVAAGVVRVLAARGWPSFGMGGAACASAGMRIIADFRASAAMGLSEVVTRLPGLVLMHARLMRTARDEHPAAAVLVSYSEYNHHLGMRLRRLGIPVLRCGAPQVWAWRGRRIGALARSLDRLAVMLPFERALFRDAGIDASYVGHPALDVAVRSRSQARALLGIDSHVIAVALLPGSRAHEVRRLAPALLKTVVELEQTGRTVEARVVVAPSLEPATASWLRGLARSAKIGTIEVSPELGASEWLSAFDASLTASGTATLESALAAVPPVIVYRLSPLTATVARRLVRTQFIGLPNILLGAQYYPELLQEEATPRRMARELARVLDTQTEFGPLASSLRRLLESVSPQRATCSERIAAMMHDWLGLPREEASIDARRRRALPA